MATALVIMLHHLLKRVQRTVMHVRRLVFDVTQLGCFESAHHQRARIAFESADVPGGKSDIEKTIVGKCRSAMAGGAVAAFFIHKDAQTAQLR